MELILTIILLLGGGIVTAADDPAPDPGIVQSDMDVIR
jgi:hypothetical protein